MADPSQPSLDRHNQTVTITKDGKRRIAPQPGPQKRHKSSQPISSAEDMRWHSYQPETNANDTSERGSSPPMDVIALIGATAIDVVSLPRDGKGEHQRVIDKAHDVADGQNEEEWDLEKSDGDINAVTSDRLSPCGNEGRHQERETVAGDRNCIEVDKSVEDVKADGTSARPSSPLGAQGSHQERDAEINNIMEEQQGDQGVHGSMRDSVKTVVDNESETVLANGVANVADLVECGKTKRWVHVASENLLVKGLDGKQTTIAVGISCRPVQAKPHAPKSFTFRRDFPDGYAGIENKDQLISPPIPDNDFGVLKRPHIYWNPSLADAANDKAKTSQWRQKNVERLWHEAYGKRFDKV